MEYDNISKSVLLGTLLIENPLATRHHHLVSTGNAAYKILSEIYNVRQHIKGSGMYFSKSLQVILVDRSFFFITIYMKIEFVNFGSWLRMSMNRLSVFLLNSLKIFIRLCTYLLKGTSSKISKNKQENKLAGR